jgi:hypothetical protein
VTPAGSSGFVRYFKGADDGLRGGLVAVAYLGSGVKVRSAVHYIEWRDPPGR